MAARGEKKNWEKGEGKHRESSGKSISDARNPSRIPEFHTCIPGMPIPSRNPKGNPLNPRRTHRNPHPRPFPAASRSPEGKRIHGNGSGNVGAAGGCGSSNSRLGIFPVSLSRHSRGSSPASCQESAKKIAEEGEEEKLPKLSGKKNPQNYGILRLAGKLLLLPGRRELEFPTFHENSQPKATAAPPLSMKSSGSCAWKSRAGNARAG